MQKIITLITLSLFSIHVFGQSNYQQFKKLCEEDDTTKAKSFLAAWEKSNPDDPELYTSQFNYYFSNSRQELISLQQEAPKGEGFQIEDSTGKVVGFIGPNTGYDPGKLEKAFQCINTGIEKFPDRLDMRFGKCYVLGKIGDYDNFTKEIIRTVAYSVINKNNWLWTENKKQDDGERFMLSAIQDYLGQLYETQEDRLLDNMIQIGEATLQHYPKSVEILSTTSVAFLLKKEYDKALGYLKQAEELNPQDYIVLNNIAQGYKLKGDKVNAIKYYALTEKYGDEEAKQQARENIKELRK